MVYHAVIYWFILGTKILVKAPRRQDRSEERRVVMYQVVVVGAGPAGAYLAYLLANQGISVLVLEKEHLPRYKTCGGGVTPKVIRLLEFDVDPVIEDTVHRIVFTYRLERPVIVCAPSPIIYTVSRERFDAFLVDKAKEAGAEVREGIRIEGVRLEDGCACIYAGDTEWRGSILVGADGARSVVARGLGLGGARINAAALEIEVPVPACRLEQNQGTIKIDYGLVPGGYAWVFPKADHLSVGVGSFAAKSQGLRLHLDQVLQAEGLGEFSRAAHPHGWIIPLSPEPRTLHRDRALVLGDAAGLAYAFTGEGIYAAILSAHLAAGVIAEHINDSTPDLSGYSDLVHERMLPEIKAAFQFTQWFTPAAGLIHRVLRRHQGLAEEIIRVVQGDATYAQFIKTFGQQMRTTTSVHQPPPRPTL